MSKKEYMKKLTKDGIINALALDQRGSLRKMMTKANPNREFTDEDIERFKELVTSQLTNNVSAILLDPQFGLTAKNERMDNCGLLMAYEKTGYDTSTPGRMPDLIPEWSVYKLKEIGVEAVKFMLYYDVDEPIEINLRKQAFVERVGSECNDIGLPFFLELMSYDSKISDTKSKEYARIKPHKVNTMIAEFSKPKYKVDVLKVEVPINLDYVEGFANEDDVILTQEEAKGFFKKQAELANGVPYIFLSGGVSSKRFRDTLIFAKEADSLFNGVLCGRATWADSVAIYAKKGEEACVEWLQSQGQKNIEELNKVLKISATKL
ncbi:tagatose 1,6-diphosphate aldolase [Ligilactobacillus equi]|nr:tagatose 1,6-diphosphate aldolase [Ligilactobacillus equi]